LAERDWQNVDGEGEGRIMDKSDKEDEKDERKGGGGK